MYWIVSNSFKLKLVQLSDLSSFPLFLSMSSFQAILPVNWYVVWGTFFWTFSDLQTTTVNPFPSCIYTSVFFSHSCVQTSWWIHPASVLWVTNGILSFFLVSIRDRAIIWKSYLEHNFNIHVFLLIRISKPTNRQQEQNMIK